MNKVVVKKFIEDENKEQSLFEIPSRGLLVGPSGCGKTTLLYNLIINYWIPYLNLYLFTKNIDQPVYKKLKKIFDDIPSIITHFSNDDIISVDDCEPNSLVVFDDFLLENQKLIKEYFIRSRSKNISVIYLTQNYTSVDIKTIRNNLNVLIVFNQSNYYIEKIWSDLISKIIPLEKFKEICRTYCKTYDKKNKIKTYGFITIDLIKNLIYDNQ
jgi:GTPase SAR1 family protein